MALLGSQRQVLQAILEISKGLKEYVSDIQISDFTKINLVDVRDWLITLKDDGLVSVIRAEDGLKVCLEAKGQIELREYRSRLSQIKGDRPADGRATTIRPRGLRSFGSEDADFFLDLLPGPRNSDGLPVSIRFWKERIEARDEHSFSVGIIYGPSGCGKTSLMKAGLLPQLAVSVTSVYVEVTPGGTEVRLLKELKRLFPDLADGLDLTGTIFALRQGRGLEADRKVLLVLDQFEQWLLANRGCEGTELVRAFKHCDEDRVQAILMVRDDFLAATIQVMEEIGIEFRSRLNATRVDLFTLPHAARVLVAFGQAYGILQDRLTTEQREFITQAVKALAFQDGMIIPVRLALFFETIKSREWTTQTLQEIGNAEGLGVVFLEKTFNSDYADPRLRSHREAAKSVLGALLPESGSEIKRPRRPWRELLDASGYASRPELLDELLRILDSELRLITPTALEDSAGVDQPTSPHSEAYYQLTHDYLVPSIREWLTLKQRETRRGRAELRLAERSSLWNAKPENRHLPSLMEWANIWLLTKRRDWSEPQRKMMKRAGRAHGLRTLGVVAGLVSLVLLGLDIRRRVVEANREAVAAVLVDQVVGANIDQVPNIVRSMEGYRRWVDPALRQVVERSSERSSERLHASLALLPVDDEKVEYLVQRLQDASADEVPVLRDALEPHQSTLTPKLWTVLESAKPGDASLLPAASALASYAPDDARWEAVGGKVAQALAWVNPVFLGSWIEALRPVRNRLMAPLDTIFRDKSRPESERTLATNILTDYASDDPILIANLLMDADPKAYAAFFPIAQRHEANTLPLFQSEIDKKVTIPDSDKDSEMVKDRLAERQARAAVALVRMGKTEKVWPLLRHSADPRLRSFIVNWLNPLGADPKLIAVELDRLPATANPTPAHWQQLMDAVLFNPETSQRRALILALGTYGMEGLSSGEREPLIGKLLDLYRNDPDSGIHGATEWTLRQWKQQEKLKKLDAELSKLKDRGNRRWYVNSQGQPFAVIEGPVEFRMGSPPTETERNAANETPHRMVIPHRFAIAATEVSVRQFRRFRPDYDQSLQLRSRCGRAGQWHQLVSWGRVL